MSFFNKINNDTIVNTLKQLRNRRDLKYFVRMSRKPWHSTKMCLTETGSPHNWQVGG